MAFILKAIDGFVKGKIRTKRLNLRYGKFLRS
jgi:hypothetical protein